MGPAGQQRAGEESQEEARSGFAALAPAETGGGQHAGEGRAEGLRAAHSGAQQVRRSAGNTGFNRVRHGTLRPPPFFPTLILRGLQSRYGPVSSGDLTSLRENPETQGPRGSPGRWPSWVGLQ